MCSELPRSRSVRALMFVASGLGKIAFPFSNAKRRRTSASVQSFETSGSLRRTLLPTKAVPKAWVTLISCQSPYLKGGSGGSWYETYCSATLMTKSSDGWVKKTCAPRAYGAPRTRCFIALTAPLVNLSVMSPLQIAAQPA